MDAQYLCLPPLSGCFRLNKRVLRKDSEIYKPVVHFSAYIRYRYPTVSDRMSLPVGSLTALTWQTLSTVHKHGGTTAASDKRCTADKIRILLCRPSGANMAVAVPGVGEGGAGALRHTKGQNMRVLLMEEG
jgi:hypothetical protein